MSPLDRAAVVALAFVGACVADLPAVYVLVTAAAEPGLVIPLAGFAMLAAFAAGLAIERKRPPVRLAAAAVIILQLPFLALVAPLLQHTDGAPAGALPWAAVSAAAGVLALAVDVTGTARGRAGARPRPR